MSEFINSRKYFLLFILISSFCGTLYAIVVKDNSSLLYTVNSFFEGNFQIIPGLEIFRQAIITYLIPAILIFIGTMNKNLLPIAVVSLFYMIFSYSFTFTCLVILYGIQGILATLMISGFSSVAIIGVLVEIFYKGISYSILKTDIIFKHFIDFYIKALLVIFGISLYDAIFIQHVRILVKNVLFSSGLFY